MGDADARQGIADLRQYAEVGEAGTQVLNRLIIGDDVGLELVVDIGGRGYGRSFVCGQ
jgi:hypothetical protein